MSSVNRVQIIGFLTQEVNKKEVWNWISVADLNIHSTSVIINKDWENQTLSSYHNVTLWRGLADIAEKYTEKGSQVYISWRLETQSWDWEDWNKRYKTVIMADDLVLLSWREPESIEWKEGKNFSGLNRTDLLWNITNDLELKTTPNWASVCSFSIATNRKFKNNQTWEWEDKAEFTNVVIWNELAEELVENASKWKKVFISWRVQTRSYETPDWVKKYTTEVVASSLRVLWFKNDSYWDRPQNTSSSSDKPSENTSSTASDIKPEDLPF
jgi:single-strand DNA-binding protein